MDETDEVEYILFRGGCPERSDWLEVDELRRLTRFVRNGNRFASVGDLVWLRRFDGPEETDEELERVEREREERVEAEAAELDELVLLLTRLDFGCCSSVSDSADSGTATQPSFCQTPLWRTGTSDLF